MLEVQGEGVAFVLFGSDAAQLTMGRGDRPYADRPEEVLHTQELQDAQNFWIPIECSDAMRNATDEPK